MHQSIRRLSRLRRALRLARSPSAWVTGCAGRGYRVVRRAVFRPARPVRIWVFGLLCDGVDVTAQKTEVRRHARGARSGSRSARATGSDPADPRGRALNPRITLAIDASRGAQFWPRHMGLAGRLSRASSPARRAGKCAFITRREERGWTAWRQRARRRFVRGSPGCMRLIRCLPR